MEIGHFDKHIVEIKTKKDPTWKHFGAFSPRCYKNYILNGKFNPESVQFLWFSKKGKGGILHSLP